MARLAHTDTVVLIDDVDEAPILQDVEQAEREGLIVGLECISTLTQTDKRFASLDTWNKKFCTAFYSASHVSA